MIVIRLSVFLAGIMVLVNGFAFAGTGPKQQRPLILAYYYPWYLKGDWSRHTYVGTPTLGKYGTDDPAIAEQHIKWARAGGIDAFVVSWWGSDNITARHTRKGFLKARNLKSFRFLLIYESLGRLDALDGSRDSVIDFGKPMVSKQFTEDIKHLNENIFH